MIRLASVAPFSCRGAIELIVIGMSTGAKAVTQSGRVAEWEYAFAFSAIWCGFDSRLGQSRQS